ncbi:MAG: hypothetical protein IPF97_08030 [Sphingomonadales bacterium]|nr:hypothetical protein [Sphingomonadales bacterium]
MWNGILGKLSDEYDRLKIEKGELLSASIEQVDATTPFSYFQIDYDPLGYFERRIFFNWGNYLGTGGNIGLVGRNDIFSALTFYDAVVVQIFPVPESVFELYHPFAISDFPRIVGLSQQRRVFLWLSGPPAEFQAHSYLEPLFEGATVVSVPWQMDGIANLNAYSQYETFDRYVEKLVERPDIARAIRESAINNHEELEITESAILLPLQDLQLYGMTRIKNSALRMLRRNPEIAMAYLHTVRRVIFNPIRYGKGITHCWNRSEFLGLTGKSGLKPVAKNISFPVDFGGLLENKIALPQPKSWDSIRWAEDHLDLALIRSAIRAVEEDVQKGTMTYEAANHYKSTINDTWEGKMSSAGRIKNVAFWTTTLAIGAAGALASGPLVGVLAGLGLATLANVTASPFSSRLAKLLSGNAFHIWEVGQKTLPMK